MSKINLPNSVVNVGSGDLGGTGVSPKVVSVLGGKIPLASGSYIDLCTAWNNGSGVIPAVTPATALTVTFNSTTTGTVTTGVAPASGSIISDALPAGTTYTAVGNNLTLSNAANESASAPAWAGPDITTALQAALNYFNAQNINGTVEFSSGPGVYLINGAQQTGTAYTVNYTGQVLAPARVSPATAPILNLRVKGGEPYAGMWSGATYGGVILLGNGGSGNIFSAIPGFNLGSNRIFTAVNLTFEDVTVRSVSNPQGNAINGANLSGMRFVGSCCVDAITNATLTGSGYGILWPVAGNFAQLHQSGELLISGYPNGTNTGEHLLSDFMLISSCTTAIVVTNGAHPVKFTKVCIQTCTNGVKPVGSQNVHLTGFFDVGDGSLATMFNDPSNVLYGDIQIAPVNYSLSGADAEMPGLGFASNGGQNLSLRHYVRRPSVWPADTFTRVENAYPQTYTNGPGATDSTMHVWSAGEPVSFPAAGGMKGTYTALSTWFLKYNAGRNNLSRLVRLKFTLGASGWNTFLALAKPVSGSNNAIWVSAGGSQINIQKAIGATSYTLASSSTGLLVANTSYTLDVLISNPYSDAGAFTITAFLNGTQAATYTIASGDTGGNSITQLADSEQFFTLDGIGMYDDTTTTITEFAVTPYPS
jgi:hypothetical protein